jgi:predicted nucleic acid-binding protein
MNIIVDTNILFAALIKNSTTRDMILDYDGSFLCPTVLILEFEKYKNSLIQKSGLSKSELDELFGLLMKKIFIVSSEYLFPYASKASEIVSDIDKDDIPFIACALAYPNSILWSNDSALKKQKVVKVMDTEEIMTILK